MSLLAVWQDAFAAGLRGAEHPLAAHPAFAVYRNTVWKGWIDAVEANYPAVASLTGSDWARAAGAAFAEVRAPTNPMMSLYGEGFADFLAEFPPAGSLPFLPDVARLDRAWTEAHLAADAPVLELGALAQLDAGAMERTHCRLHPSVRFAWFATTIPTLWLANRTDFEGGELLLDDRPEGLLLARPAESVEALVLDAAAFAFLDACRNGATLLDCAIAALAADPKADLGGLLGRLIGFGAFTDFFPIDPEPLHVPA
ncbi:DNA-binding domain-containing protein [Phenylobacterium sp.]|uniref:HvfC/BufC N-terminal domain-containing protein n=1 Tax=Phenylobacterium sp. TaxID=1871053 RepID=UPI0027349CC1|nr:DNA-binding domain-containing protein [Phenylobacterium sp.]MDP3853537.1 DNA-binding domain-containing protein [Phenylobacterium sp.]